MEVLKRRKFVDSYYITKDNLYIVAQNLKDSQTHNFVEVENYYKGSQNLM